jgi:hypothetical protein
MDESEAELLRRLKNALQGLEEFGLRPTESVEELKQRLRNLISYLEGKSAPSA